MERKSPIQIKSPQEIEIMKEGGKIAAAVREKVLATAKQGISTLELDALAEKLILEAGVKPSFKGFEGFPFATCINVNEGIVHGLPTERKLKAGDILTVDLGVFYKGLHTDTARTIGVEKEQGSDGLGLSSPSSELSPREPCSETDKFLNTGQKALEKAIEQCQIGNNIGDISHAIQAVIEGAGYNVTRELGGHGVGKKLHEPPFIPGFGQPGEGPVLKEGMTLAIEVIYARGSGKIEVLNDGWTVVTVDGNLAGLFEHTVAVTQSGPIILTNSDSLVK